MIFQAGNVRGSASLQFKIIIIIIKMIMVDSRIRTHACTEEEGAHVTLPLWFELYSVCVFSVDFNIYLRCTVS